VLGPTSLLLRSQTLNASWNTAEKEKISRTDNDHFLREREGEPLLKILLILRNYSLEHTVSQITQGKG
jgi:hypothetical protein